MQYIIPLIEPWGVRIINFQIESTKIADATYAAEYEAASLGVSKAKANLRAVSAENEIMLSKSKAAAQARLIDAEGQREATLVKTRTEADSRIINAEAEARARNIGADADAKAITILAEADAKARKIEAAARNEAAEMLRNEFGKQFALVGQQVEFAKSLKMQTLTVLPDSLVGQKLSGSLNPLPSRI